MEGVTMKGTKLTYNPETDLYYHKDGRFFLKNEFDPDNPIYLDVSKNIWKHKLPSQLCGVDWRSFKFNAEQIKTLQEYLIKKLKVNSIKYLQVVDRVLFEIDEYTHDDWEVIGDLKTSEIFDLWSAMTPHYRSYFREMYSYMVKNEKCGASYNILCELKEAKSRSDIVHLRDVLYWSEEKGALTRKELNVFNEILYSYKKVRLSDFPIIIYAWLALTTLKRSSQILKMERFEKSIKKIKHGSDYKYYAEIKPIKNQTGQKLRYWPIPKDLFEAIKYYSLIDEVKERQDKYNRLIVWDSANLQDYGVLSSMVARTSVVNFFKKFKSPRTNKPFHITQTRLRHTGATMLAFNGVARDLIQEILEHDSPISAQAYIDASVSEVLPAIEKADRNMGGIFAKFNDVYFNGSITEKIGEQPICIPSTTATLIVGDCNKDTVSEGGCTKHPFIGCYNGCFNFLAWRKADHEKALQFVDNEIDKINKSGVTKINSIYLKELNETKERINDLVSKIEEMDAA